MAETLAHLEAVLKLIQGFNGNHQPTMARCNRCENVLHTAEACRRAYHAARAFVAAVKAGPG